MRCPCEQGQLKKQRGNPNWGKAAPYTLGDTTSSFDSLVKSLGLSPEQHESASALKTWVGKNKDHKYVPPSLLEAWGFKSASEV
jgi:hypothetical protein